MSSAHAAPATSTAQRKRSKFRQSFWVANTMEIFERLAWYGFFAVSSLYITGSVNEGALGFTSEQRGQLQGIVPFILYLLPVVFGALGDRFGYKKTFIAAYAVLVPAYYLLGQFSTFGTFFMAFLFVATGAAIFKPVVVGTVARTTDETNSSMGFGIFYMMVNIGGFLGPLVAGYVRVKYGWDYVFIASSFWIGCNFVWLLLFYKEPTTESSSAQKRTIGQVLTGIVEVLGNGRFFLMVFGLLLLLMLGGKTFTWSRIGLLAAGWILLNLIFDVALRAWRKGRETGKGFWVPMRLGNWKFALYLLILSGFWTSFNQIFLTMPEYIRDFVETRDIVETARTVAGEDMARFLSAVNEDLLREEISQYVAVKGSAVDARLRSFEIGTYRTVLDTIQGNEPSVIIVPPHLQLRKEDVAGFRRQLFDFKVRVPDSVLAAGLNQLPLYVVAIHGAADAAAKRALDRADSLTRARNLDPRQTTYLREGAVAARPEDVTAVAHRFAEKYRQVNPEYIINIDAGAIVIFQVLVSYLIGFIAPLTAMVIGIIVAAVGIGMSAWLYTGWLVTLAITIFAFGEMMASPKSQEYVGRIAPRQKVAMYMGFYFWTVALGNIFGGRLSGELYGSLARDAGRPDIMWILFGGLGLLTAVILILYDRLILRQGPME